MDITKDYWQETAGIMEQIIRMQAAIIRLAQIIKVRFNRKSIKLDEIENNIEA